MKSFINKYVLLNPKDYGLELDVNLNLIIILVFLGLCVACFAINRSQSSIALVLRKLLRAEAFGEEQGRTLSELGLSSSAPVKKLLSQTTGYMKGIVTYVGAKTPSYDEFLASERAKAASSHNKSSKKQDSNKQNFAADGESDLASARFYIPADKRDAAERAFAKNNGSVTKTVVSCVALIGFMMILVLLMPAILSLISSLI